MPRKVKTDLRAKISELRKDLGLCILSAVLLILSFPNFSAVGGSLPVRQAGAFGGNLWIFAWFGFVPLFFTLQNKSHLKAFLFSYLAGVIFWFGTIYWLMHVTLPGMIILVLYLALYFGIFGLIIRNYTLHPPPYTLFFIPSLWGLLEYLRSYLFTGFPWALLGYSQYLNLPVIQIADITGVWGISFLVMMGNFVIYSVIGSRFSVIGSRFSGRKNRYLFPALFLIITLVYGYAKLYPTPNTQHRTPLKISLIQPNIPQQLKWVPEANDFVLEQHLALSELAARDNPDLIIWPEAAFPDFFDPEKKEVSRLINFTQDKKIPLLLGAVREEAKQYFNSALLIEGAKVSPRIYDKIHLVPFGEYIPLKNIFRFLETVVPIGDFTAGREYTIFELNANIRESNANLREYISEYSRLISGNSRFSVLICFEDIFPELTRRFTMNGADFLVNITNDAWFGRTSSPYQHLTASVFRAVENRRYLVRSANTGVSGFIAPTGKIISLVKNQENKNIFISGYKTEAIKIEQKRNLTFYSRYGDIFVGICLLFILYGIIRLKILKS